MTVHGVEVRVTDQPVECRSIQGKPLTIGGYAAVFGVPSQPFPERQAVGAPPNPFAQGLIVEQVDRSFFNKSQGDGWPGVVAKYWHKDEFMLGATRSGTLQLTVDNNGLYYQVELPESRRDVYDLVDRQDVAGSSFAFITYSDDWDLDEDGRARRLLLSGKLLDVGPTPQPVYEQSSAVALRSFAARFDADIIEVEQDAENGSLSKYFTRSDMQQQPELVEARSGDGGLDIRRKRNELQGKKRDSGKSVVGNDDAGMLDLLRRRNALYGRKLDGDRSSTSTPYQPYGPAPDDAQQGEEVRQAAIARRVSALRQAGVDVPDTSRGTEWTHPPAGPSTPVFTPRQPWTEWSA